MMVEMAMSMQSGTVVREGEISMKGTVNGDRIIEAFCRDYLLHRPKPKWVVVDPQTSFVDGTFAEFLQRAGIGLLATPGEAHWHHGYTERSIQCIKVIHCHRDCGFGTKNNNATDRMPDYVKRMYICNCD